MYLKKIIQTLCYNWLYCFKYISNCQLYRSITDYINWSKTKSTHSFLRYVNSIYDAHQMFQLPMPKHPLVSVFRHSDLVVPECFTSQSFSTGMYMISFKEKQEAVIKYGRNVYDFQEGTVMFIAPNQVYSFDAAYFSKCKDEWTLMFHPDFIANFNLGREVENYHFFNYESTESLNVSEDEKLALNLIIRKIEKEYYQLTDQRTQGIICVNIESCFKYFKRFYTLQFITRKKSSSSYIVNFENYLKKYFSKDLLSLKECGKALNLSPDYLSDLLKQETGKNAKEHIDLFVFKKAKIKLQYQALSLSEVAFDLGFNYPIHFNNFFKTKTGLSPTEYRSLS